MKRIVTLLVLASATICFAQGQQDLSPADHNSSDTYQAPAPPSYSHPTLPAAHTTWPFPVLMLIAVTFVSAACIGWYIRMEMLEELPEMHSHDEPPGASHHHGPAGTINPAPDHQPDDR